jgi:hypothetical protein
VASRAPGPDVARGFMLLFIALVGFSDDPAPQK